MRKSLIVKIQIKHPLFSFSYYNNLFYKDYSFAFYMEFSDFAKGYTNTVEGIYMIVMLVGLLLILPVVFFIKAIKFVQE